MKKCKYTLTNGSSQYFNYIKSFYKLRLKTESRKETITEIVKLHPAEIKMKNWKNQEGKRKKENQSENSSVVYLALVNDAQTEIKYKSNEKRNSFQLLCLYYLFINFFFMFFQIAFSSENVTKEWNLLKYCYLSLSTSHHIHKDASRDKHYFILFLCALDKLNWYFFR